MADNGYRIQMNDGRIFSGSAQQIVATMEATALPDFSTLDAYMSWASDRAAMMHGAALDVQGDTLDARCASFVAEALRVGLAQPAPDPEPAPAPHPEKR